MIQPSTLPAAPAITLAATMPVLAAEAGEPGDAGAGFAALLAIQLEATGAPETKASPLADLLTPEVTPAKIGPDGKPVPDALPPVPTVDEIETELDALVVGEADPLAITAALSLPLPVTPAEAPAVPHPGSPAHVPHAKAALSVLSIAADASAVATPKGEAKAEPDAPQAATLRLAVAAPDEKARPAPAEPVRPVTLAPQIESSTSPATTFQPIGAPPQAAPAPTAAQPHARHDFATLVDRLVEARDTALTVQTPQSVAAAVTHSEFGEVSIRFEHRGDALSVSLASADPDFSRAVQAAAPAAQANTAGCDGAQPQGQEGSGQQPTTSSGNSQQSQPQQRHGTSSTRGPIQQERDGEQKQPANGGIFA